MSCVACALSFKEHQLLPRNRSCELLSHAFVMNQWEKIDEVYRLIYKIEEGPHILFMHQRREKASRWTRQCG